MAINQLTTQLMLSYSRAWIPAAAATLLFLGLPFGRPDRPFLTIDPAFRPWNIGSIWVWLVLAFAVLSMIASFLPCAAVRMWLSRVVLPEPAVQRPQRRGARERCGDSQLGVTRVQLGAVTHPGSP